MTRLGLSYRPECAWLLHTRPDLDFLDVIAEGLDPDGLPAPLAQLVAEGRTVIPHGVGLSLGGAERPARTRLDALARLAERFLAPFVSEHVAFVRAGGVETGHLLPVERSSRGLRVLVDNVRRAQEVLPVPLVLENVACLLRWPGDSMDEAEFLRALVEETGVGLLLDVANAHANAENHDEPVEALLDRLPLHAVRYVHVAGGVRRDGLYHDTHAHPIDDPQLRALQLLTERIPLPAVVLERDGNFGSRAALEAELAAIANVVAPPQTREASA